MKKFIEFMKELRKNPYGRGVFFFGFYLIFFIFIFILLKMGSSTNSLNNIEKNNKKNINIENILDKKYSFTYKINLDNKLYLYDGKKDDNSFTFTYNDKSYMKDNEIYYVKNEDWQVVDNPIKFNNFLDENIINALLDSSTYEAKTTYNSGKKVYSYLISSNTINKIIDNKDTDFSDEPNRIKVSIEKVVNEIDIDLNSYCKVNNLCENNLHINISYDE